MLYKVHIFAVVRVPVLVEAESHADAAKRARQDTALHTILDTHVGYNVCDKIMFTDEINGYLVDEIRDDSHKNSRYFKPIEVF